MDMSNLTQDSPLFRLLKLHCTRTCCSVCDIIYRTAGHNRSLQQNDHVHDSCKWFALLLPLRILRRMSDNSAQVCSQDKAAQDKANLTRIRDNQRRSRARRKEYLQELEQRLRLYEQQGVEASTEIQQAARRVVDENKRLRLLLNENGISDNSIDSYLQSSNPSFESIPQGPSSSQESPTLVLDRLLAPRRASFDSANTSLLASSGFEQDSRRSSLTLDPQSSETSISTPLNQGAGGARYSGSCHVYASLELDEDVHSYRQGMPAFSPGSRHELEMEGVSLSTSGSRPNLHLSRHSLSDPTGMWTESRQLSPTAVMSAQPSSILQDNPFSNRSVQFTQHQSPSFSTHWPSSLASGPSTGSSVMLNDGIMPLVPNEPSRPDGYGERLEEDRRRLDDTAYDHSHHYSTRI